MMIERIVIEAFGLCIALMILFFIVFIVVYNKKVARLTNSYQKALAMAKQKLQEQTLNNISYDIIDNFGNNLFAIKINLIGGVLDQLQKMAEKMREGISNINPTEFASLIRDLQELVSKIEVNVQDTRQTVEHMNTDMINTCKRLTSSFADNSFLKNLENELNRLVGLTLNKEVRGVEYPLGKEKEIMLFWICQEALNNIIEHSNAKKLNIFIHYNQTSFFLRMKDEGVGFDQKDLSVLIKNGKGFQNMSTAAKMINADIDFESKRHEGTTISVSFQTLSI